LTECVSLLQGQIDDADTFVGAAEFDGDAAGGEGWGGVAELLRKDLGRTA